LIAGLVPRRGADSSCIHEHRFVRGHGWTVTRSRSGLAAPGASRSARSWTLALNWYPSAYVKYSVTFDGTVFDGDPDGARPAENLVLFRIQLGF